MVLFDFSSFNIFLVLRNVVRKYTYLGTSVIFFFFYSGIFIVLILYFRLGRYLFTYMYLVTFLSLILNT